MPAARTATTWPAARVATSVGRKADRRAAAYRSVGSAVAVKDGGAIALRYAVERAASRYNPCA